MDIQWFPGHMAKARGMVERNLKLVDAVIELLDARAPLSSRNPMVNEITGSKPRLVILNKSDLADERMTAEWVHKLSGAVTVLMVDSRRGRGLKRVPGSVVQISRSKLKSSPVSKARPVRCMIVGIPNVGKSLFINGLVGQKAARTGNKPGVTRGSQWIRVDSRVELLDTPGILWPKFEDRQVGFRLAVLGAIREEAYSPEEAAMWLLEWLDEHGPGTVERRYNLSPGGKVAGNLEQIARKRGFITSGGGIDRLKTAVHILKDFREGRLGRFTLDVPGE